MLNSFIINISHNNNDKIIIIMIYTEVSQYLF